MPAPPPPPPLAPAAPAPPPMFKSSKSSKSSANDRGALLKSIQQGKKLKKAVTNDRSAPQVAGTSNKPSNGGMGGGIGGMPLPVMPMGGMGGLGSGLRNGTVSSGSVTPVSPIGGMKNFGSIQMELKKQLASDNRNRGPPPPTPTRNLPTDTGGRQFFGQRENVTNGFHMSQLSLNSKSNFNSNIHANQSTLHRKAKSNANLSSLDAPDNSNCMKPNRPVISYGKPNLAPKPPVLNGKPNSLQLKINKPVSRTHSLKSPRSPSPQSPETIPMNKFGTVRHMSSIISQSLANSSTNNVRARPALSLRPTAPPPSIPVPATPNHHSMSSSHISTPPKINMVKPNHAPPPPPPVVPQAPSHAPPPPPPHKTQLNKPPPSMTGSNPPSPPPRHSSMRDINNTTKKSNNLEEKFKHLFQSSGKFPSPPPYKNVIKLYNSVSVKSAPVKPVPVA